MTNQLEIAGPPFVRYFSRSDQLIEYQAGLPVFKLPAGSGPDAETSITATSLPAGPAIATVHVGRYEDLPDAHAFLRSWAERAERAPGGAMWEVFLTNPMTQRDPSKWRTKVFLPLAPLPSGH